MPYELNRKSRRKMARPGFADQKLNEVETMARQDAMRNAWAGMMLVLHTKHGFTGEQLHQLGADTISTIRGSLCATELVERLKKLSGFDVDEPIPEEELDDFPDIPEDEL